MTGRSSIYIVLGEAEDKEFFKIASDMLDGQVDPFVRGIFAGNRDVGDLVCREDITLDTNTVDYEGRSAVAMRAHLTDGAKASGRYDEETALSYMDFILVKEEE